MSFSGAPNAKVVTGGSMQATTWIRQVRRHCRSLDAADIYFWTGPYRRPSRLASMASQLEVVGQGVREEESQGKLSTSK
jgi:hypothetical protein